MKWWWRVQLPACQGLSMLHFKKENSIKWAFLQVWIGSSFFNALILIMLSNLSTYPHTHGSRVLGMTGDPESRPFIKVDQGPQSWYSSRPSRPSVMIFFSENNTKFALLLRFPNSLRNFMHWRWKCVYLPCFSHIIFLWCQKKNLSRCY